MITYTLAGDRKIEYGFAGARIPIIETGLCLDVGPGPRARLARVACGRGWNVIGYDLGGCGYRNARFEFRHKDLLESDIGGPYGLVLCVSSIEHFGVPGRYGVNTLDMNADVRAMRKIKDALALGGQVVLTIPLGQDAMLAPFHRVYGRDGLPRLLVGYRIIEQRYWAKKDGRNVFIRVTQNEALNVKPTLRPAHYYALAGFVLEAI